MPHFTLQLGGGVVADDSSVAAKGRVVAADKMRFRQVGNEPYAEVIGGWEDAIGSTFAGTCRGLFANADLLGNPFLVAGTHSKLYAWTAGSLYDVTPFEKTSVLSAAVTTSLASTTVTINDPAHGRATGSYVNIALQTAAVGGITLSGVYQLTSVSTDYYSVTASSTASSTSSGGGVVVANYQLAPGNVDGLGQGGYGVGTYGSGSYGTSQLAGKTYPRTWSLDSWGQYTICNPRGYGVYELQPVTSNTELNLDTTFATTASWTAGTGWSVTGNAGVATAGSASTLSIAISSASVGGYYRATITATRSAGTCQVMLGSQNVGSAISASGTFVSTFLATATTPLSFSKDASFAGSITLASLKLEPYAYQITNCPNTASCAWVTGEKILALGGTARVSDGTVSPLTVRWSDQGNNTTWTPSTTNQAGDFQLSEGTKILKGLATRNQSLIFTDTALYGMRYLPGDPLIYSFPLLGVGCGIIGPNAAVDANGIIYWMGNNAQFFRYAGAVVEDVPCSLKSDLFNNIAPGQGEKVYGWYNSRFNEVWWLYPDNRDGTECSRYVSLQLDNGWWSQGIFTRTAGCDQGVLPYPIMTGTDGIVYYHDKGTSGNGASFSASMEIFPQEIAEGEGIVPITRIIPDFKNFTGGCSVSLYARHWPQDSVTIYGPYTIGNSTLKYDLRVAARQLGAKLVFSGAPNTARMGAVRFDIRPTGAKR